MKRITCLSVMLVFSFACAALRTPAALPTQPAPATSTELLGTVTAKVPPPTVTAMPAATGPANAAAFPDPSAYQWAPVVSGLTNPTDIQFPDDGSGRMFILEQPGRIRIARGGQLLDQPFLDITDRVGSNGSEQGLLGLALDPNFPQNGRFFVNYTDQQGNTTIARYQANGDTADPSSEKVLLHIDQPFPNHNGGVLAFGPDGYLYAGLGDGGSEGDPLDYGQNTQVLLGKLLRLDVSGDTYGVPPNNPFVRGGGKPEIWAFGLRNPWRISFDKATGDLYIADVGQDQWEEVDVIPAGSPGGVNFGWNYMEGNHVYSVSPPAGLQITYPVVEYSHAEGGCSITGGYVYRGAMQEWQGVYLYGDYCSGKIWGLMHSNDPSAVNGWASKLLFQTTANITTFGQDPAGEVYFADRGGTIFKLQK